MRMGGCCVLLYVVKWSQVAGSVQANRNNLCSWNGTGSANIFELDLHSKEYVGILYKHSKVLFANLSVRLVRLQ